MPLAYEVPDEDVKAALAETGLMMLGLNTRRGDVAGGENGLAALPGREADARAAIDEAIAYAVQIDTPNIHVMAGFAAVEVARSTFVRNLAYACGEAAIHGKTILIEPLNVHDAPGHFLNHIALAAEIIGDVSAPNLNLMFDRYHVGRTEGDVIAQLERHPPIIGHIQFAGVPDRGTPDQENADFRAVFKCIRALGGGIQA